MPGNSFSSLILHGAAIKYFVKSSCVVKIYLLYFALTFIGPTTSMLTCIIMSGVVVSCKGNLVVSWVILFFWQNSHFCIEPTSFFIPGQSVYNFNLWLVRFIPMCAPNGVEWASRSIACFYSWLGPSGGSVLSPVSVTWTLLKGSGPLFNATFR
jgi:hypothetical protein